ncbi:hypothetical protein QYE76_068200 [Lolium multiflorum]|uniref:Integrase catalytic domain-containing protein n=1 Tax=Lolium multiflorum TaxID=4521 RepID=A0AAD8SE18_LOLMU|nr:hypothetical protein QYE76_068200 [Lolium multiflorum]
MSKSSEISSACRPPARFGPADLGPPVAGPVWTGRSGPRPGLTNPAPDCPILARLTGPLEKTAKVASHQRPYFNCSVELWEIIVDGYRKPQDPARLTSTEFYNRQLNASARDKIRSGINRKLLDQVNDIDSAKELWDRIVVLQEGTDLIQSALYESAKQEATMFMIREGESVADAYGRLGALRVKVKGLGCEKYNDGFEMNEHFIKSKVIAMIAVKQKDTNLALNLQIITKSADLNADDLVSYVAANENMAKAGERLMAMNRVDEGSHNLALKARADHEREEAYEIEEDEEMTSTSDIATDFAFFAKKYKAKFPMLLNEKKKKKRTATTVMKMVTLQMSALMRKGLKKELAKFTTTKNKMGLDDLLSKQRSNNQKHGLGYVPKPYKKNNYKKEKPAQEKNKKVTNNGKASKGKATSGDRTGPNNHYALFIDYYGDVYANYVGPPGKQLKKKHPIKSIVTTSRPLELLHLDLFGPSHYDTLGGSKYGLVIVDDYSRYSWVFLLKSKDETHREFIIFAKKAQRMYESEIKAIRTDNGTEFKNYTMQEFVDDEGIKHEFSAPYTLQQNGVVERKNRTIIEMARTMSSEFNSPHNFLVEAISTVVHYSNRLFLRPLHNKTPYELLTGNKPNVMYIRVFGCKCLVKNNKGKLGKFETRTIEGIFVGYAENSHAYRYYNKSTGTIEVSCDVVFLEDNGSQVEQVVPCVAGNDDDPS